MLVPFLESWKYLNVMVKKSMEHRSDYILPALYLKGRRADSYLLQVLSLVVAVTIIRRINTLHESKNIYCVPTWCHGLPVLGVTVWLKLQWKNTRESFRSEIWGTKIYKKFFDSLIHHLLFKGIQQNRGEKAEAWSQTNLLYHFVTLRPGESHHLSRVFILLICALNSTHPKRILCCKD